MRRATSVALCRDASRDAPLGQVPTPRVVADWMTAWACADRPRRVLEPAMGAGVFVSSLDAYYRARPGWARPRIDACELDTRLIRRLDRSDLLLSLECRRADFLRVRYNWPFDAVLANPPYVRHHELDYDEETLREFDRLAGRRISRMTNLYGLFMLRIVSLLAPRGRAAIIMPAEWLNADFGVPLKAHLLEQNAMDGIVHFSHRSMIFPTALTTAAILLLRRGRGTREPIRLACVEDAAALNGRTLREARCVDAAELSPARKWSSIIETGSPLRVARRRLGDVAACSRGIATGANGYFVLRPSQCHEFGISLRDVRLCIARARQIAGDRLTGQVLGQLIAADEPVYLLSPRKELTPAVRAYLAEGRRKGIDRRYLPSHRPEWFRPEQREPAPILISVFARGSFRVVLNTARALNLTAYHGIYPRKPTAARVRALYEFLISPAGQKALALHRRIYGGGLSKLEPRDVEAVELPEAVHEKLI